jgi:hypothetical protein
MQQRRYICEKDKGVVKGSILTALCKSVGHPAMIQ